MRRTDGLKVLRIIPDPSSAACRWMQFGTALTALARKNGCGMTACHAAVESAVLSAFSEAWCGNDPLRTADPTASVFPAMRRYGSLIATFVPDLLVSSRALTFCKPPLATRFVFPVAPGGSQVPALFVFFKELVKQHRIDRFVAHRLRFSFFVAE